MAEWEKEISCIHGYHIDQLVWLPLVNRFPVKYLHSHYSFLSNYLPLNDFIHDSLKQLLWGELLRKDPTYLDVEEQFSS